MRERSVAPAGVIRRTATAIMLLGAWGACAFRAPASAQDCGDCTIVLREVVRLGDREGPGALVTATEALVRTDSRGRYFVSRSGGTEILVFDSLGSHLRTLGRDGDGPGEFRNALGILIAPGDSLFVFDNAVARLTVFGPELDVARMTRLGPVPFAQLLMLDDGHVVAAMSVNTPERSGYPLHLFDRAGEIVTSFGSRTREFGPGFQQRLNRAIARETVGDVVWSARIFRYEITAWDTANVLRGRIVREVDWFPPRVDGSSRSATDFSPPEPSLQEIHVDGTGNLWVGLYVADERWRDAIPPDQTPTGGFRITSPVRYRDSVVERIDRTGRLLARARLDGLITGFLPGERIVVAMEDELGFPYISIQEPVNR